MGESARRRPTPFGKYLVEILHLPLGFLFSMLAEKRKPEYRSALLLVWLA